MKKLFLAFLLLASAPLYGADTKVTAMTNLGTLASGDEFYCVDDPAGTPLSRACTIDVILAFIEASLSAIPDGLIVEPDLDADNSATDGDILTYDSTGTNFAWITQNAGTDITADLEEESHGSEHNEGGADEVTVEALGTACTNGQAFDANATTGVECVTVGGDVSGALDALVVADNSHNHTESNISDLSHTVETNDLESVATNAADAEVFVGTGAGTGAYISGLAACAADEKIEYVPGAPDTFTCEAIGSLVEADISDLNHLTEAEARTGLIENGSAEMTVETLGTACTDGQLFEANATGGADCVTTGGDVSGPADAFVVADNSHNHTESNISDLAHTPDTTLTVGTSGTLAKFGASDLADSIASESAGVLTLAAQDLRLLFDDNAGTVTHDWQLTINDTDGGSAKYFRVSNITDVRAVFTLYDTALNNSIVADGDGVGILTADPTEALDVTGNIAVSGTVDGVDIAARDHDAITLAGTPDYITLAGQVLTRGTVDISDDTNLAAGTGATLTGDSISVDLGADIAVSELAAGTDGELITWDSSGNATTVAVGTSGHVLTSNGAGAAPTFQAAAGGGSMPAKEFNFPAASLSGGMAPDDSWPAFGHDSGTNIDINVLGFDADTDECAGGTLTVPSDVDTSGTITFRAVWYSGTATSGNIMWDFRHSTGQAEGVTWDTALTTEAAAADATQGTVDQLTTTTWTETVSTAAWAASDTVSFLVCRDANHASDTLAGDAQLLHFTIEVPRA